MTDDEIRRFTAALDDPLVFGALQRFHNEVLPRDRPADPVKTAEGGVFNTADVVTGGAFAYFVRKYVSEAIIAQGHGRTAAQASGDGYDAAFRAYTQVVNPQPPVTGTPADPPSARLEVRDGRLWAGGTYVNYQAMSLFTLIGHAMQGRGAEAGRQLDRAARAGRNAARIFAMLDPVNGGFGPVSRFTPFDAGWADAAEAVVNSAAARGMRVQMNIFADAQRLMPDAGRRRECLRLVAEQFRNHPAVWFRLANEPYQNGWSAADDTELLELADQAASILGHRDFAIGDVPDHGSESGSPEQKASIRRLAERSRILVVHPDRHEEAGRERPIEHLKSVYETYEDVAPEHALILDEPRGFAGTRQLGRRDNRPSVAMADACTAAILGCGYTYHHIAEQDDAVPGLAESAYALRVPVSPNYTFKNAGTGGSWVTGFSGYMKVRTCDHGSEGWAIAHGPNGSVETVWPLDAGRGAAVRSEDLLVTLYCGH
jgi:hypothetical protein